MAVALANSNKSAIMCEFIAICTLRMSSSMLALLVVTTPGAILTPWSGDVDAILINFLPGEQAGNAVADGRLGPGLDGA